MAGRIMAAPTGARRTKADHPRLPMTVEEIAADAAACAAAGADELHLHVRDAEGRHTLDAGLYAEATAAVAEAAPTLAVQITTEAAGRFTPAEQLSCLETVRPRAASAAIRELGADQAVTGRFYALADEAGIEIQHILFDDADAARLADGYAAGLIPETMRRAIFVLGAYAPPVNAAAGDLPPRLEAAAALGLDWSVCAFGSGELDCLAAALRLGGDARVGFENNILHPDGRLAESNAAQVAALVAARGVA